MTAEKVHYLSKVDYLSEFSPQELSEVAADFYWAEYAQGTDIIGKGQERNQFYVLVEGKTEVLDCNRDSGHIRVNTFGPGDAFGARSLVTGDAAPFTVRCLEDCKVLVMSAEDFARMLDRLPKFYKKFIERMAQNLDQVNSGLWAARHKEFLHTTLQHNRYESKFYGFWGSPKTTKFFKHKISELSQSDEHLLLIGERGTGRQMMAWCLHKEKFGESAPFVVVDGRDLEKQWGDQLFTTKEQKISNLKSSSLFEYVAGGTLFVQEINELSPRTQLKLAEALSSHKNTCLVIGSLQKDPELLAQLLIPELQELFSDLFKITPLRERKRDIPYLAQGILEKLAKQHNRKAPKIDHEATKLLLSHNYNQGNVTELIQVLERAFFLAEGDEIRLEHVFFGPTAKKIGGTFDLLSFEWVERLLTKGSFVTWLQRITALIFITIISSLFLSPEITVAIGVFALVWGLWWPALAVLSPLLGRVWCTVCPFSYVMDAIQKKFHLNRPVPNIIKKYNYLLISFLFLLILWVEIVTNMRSNPLTTGLLLTTIMAAAILIGVIYRRHTFCHHLCPLGGFIGMASIGAMLEVRADSTVCINKCTTFDCYKGTSRVAGCPLSKHAPYVDNNLDCKLCFNCVRNCPNGAVKFNLRVPAREVWRLLRVNQGFVIFIGVSLAILAPINYFEPLRQSWPIDKWVLWFSLFYWGAAILGGVITWFLARPFQTKAASRRVKLVFSLVPLVIAGHIIYQLHFLPGADSILLGLGYKTATGEISAINVPALGVVQSLAALIGVVLTGFTFAMVLVRSRKRKSKQSLSSSTASQAHQLKQGQM